MSDETIKWEVKCEDCGWEGKLVELISDIIIEDVVSVCPNCRSFPLSPRKELCKTT